VQAHRVILFGVLKSKTFYFKLFPWVQDIYIASSHANVYILRAGKISLYKMRSYRTEKKWENDTLIKKNYRGRRKRHVKERKIRKIYF